MREELNKNGVEIYLFPMQSVVGVTYLIERVKEQPSRLFWSSPPTICIENCLIIKNFSLVD